MTHIKRMVVQGFKSFAKKTDIVFDKGINVFVGPNGGGKSNIVESLCFVLGRLSAKSMRAAKARNLIFMGSKYVKPAKEAFVEMIFDNNDRAFSIENNEINLKRIVRTNGQSIYKINGETKTRAEIIEMLAQAGIDPYGFNLILQGQIQSIVRMHAEDRRKIIEEVAGISIYESRKEKSLHELEKTDERLKEISTILREKTAYLRNLEKEKTQAQKYKDSELMVKRAKASIINIKLEEKKKELKGVINSIEKGENEKTGIRKKIEGIQGELDELSAKINDINKHIQKSSGVEQETLNDELANLKAELEGLRVRKENYGNREREIEKRIEEMSKSIPEIEAEIKELREKSPLMARKAAELKKKKDELGAIGEERKRVLTLRTELQSLKERIKDREKQLVKAEAASESLFGVIEEHSKGLEYNNEEGCLKAVHELEKVFSEKEKELALFGEREIENEKIISVIDSEIKNTESIKFKVEKIDVCPLCQSKITGEHVKHVCKEAEEKIAKVEEEKKKALYELKSIKEKRDKLSKEIRDTEIKISKGEIELINHRNLNEKKELLKKYVNEENSLKEEIGELEGKRKKLEEKSSDLGGVEEKYEKKMLEIEEISSRTEEDVDTTLLYKERELENIRNVIKASKNDIEEIEEDIREISEHFEEKTERLDALEGREKELQEQFKKMFASRDRMQKETQERSFALSGKQQEMRQIEEQVNYLKIGKAKLDAEKESLEMELSEFAGIELIQGSINVLEERLRKVQELVQSIGPINMRALEVYDMIKKEYDIVQEKVNTLDKEKEDIMKIIEEIDKKKGRTFIKTFKAINERFSDNFSKLSSKGIAYLDIENKEDIFAGGINIVVKLAKGKYFDVTSLSGGEQTLVALSLLFAIQEYKPYHFYVFDEIDAALDKRNSERLATLLDQYMKSGQYIVITHNDAIINNSNALYGVTMHEGISKVLSLKLDGPKSLKTN